MSQTVSQIEYWREVNKPDKNTTNAKNDKEGGPGAIYLSYDVFLGLSILGGLLALDHLYLRSPLTFLLKIVLNIITLGTWWLYDATQAVFNKDVVKVFGLGVPGLGPKGIAAGVLASDVPDKKHMAFFIYALALILGGIFGLDSFIVGDKQSGLIRLVCLITGILAPIAIFWWLFNLGKFFIKTKDVVSLYWEYFGAPPPAEHGMTLGEKIITKFPFLEKIFGPVQRVKNAAVKVAEGLEQSSEDFVETLVTDPGSAVESAITAPLTFAEKVITSPLERVGDSVNKILTNTTGRVATQLKPAINAAIAPATVAIEGALQPAIAAVQPLKNTINSGIAVAQTGLSTAQEGLALGKTALNTGKELADKTLNVAGKTANAATKALTLAPAAAALTDGFTESAASAALSKLEQKGGGSDSGVLPFVLIGTFAVIAVSGLILTYRRYRQNEQPRKDDSPPEPGVLRESDKKESS